MAEYNKERRWTTPSKRAASYVEERKAKVHMHGQKEGKPHSDYEARLRSGYLQCQSDHNGHASHVLSVGEKFIQYEVAAAGTQ